MKRLKKYASIAFVILVATLAILEAIPQKHVNPPVRQEPAWNQPATRTLAKRACFDCHSNETRWPAYAAHPPVAWLIQRDVGQGRSALNFSEWNRPQGEVQEVLGSITSGKMPPRLYLLTHSEANLKPSERTALLNGLQQTLGFTREPEASHPEER